jgi:excisionase family DNA binding protein
VSLQPALRDDDRRSALNGIEHYVTPNTLAQLLGVGKDKVHQFIRCGELKAFDVRSPGKQSPRYRIPESAVNEFLERRAAASGPQVSPASPRRAARRAKDDAAKQWFK